jgi:16S rRNA (adenine1518-N6/adenine1519-N6)-dimethyltransferase
MSSKFPKKTFAKKSFGQNFLVDENYISRIISTLNLQKGETVIEIGAGRGALTEGLVESGANVVAIEFERDMIAVLKEKFADAKNFTLIESDALKIDYSGFQIPDSKLKIKLVANLPYNISTAILQKLIKQREVFSEMILMFQFEVVERITAEVGNSERGFLSVLVQNYLETEMLFDVPPSAFRPAPKVMSAIARLTPKTENPFENDKLFRKIISAAFFQKRKTIFNNLKNFRLENLPDIDWLKILETAEIVPNRRAETLTLEEWQNLCKTLENQTK